MKESNNIYISAVLFCKNEDGDWQANVVSVDDPYKNLDNPDDIRVRVWITNLHGNRQPSISPEAIDAELKESCNRYNNGSESANLNNSMLFKYNGITAKIVIQNIMESDKNNLFEDLIRLYDIGSIRNNTRENHIQRAFMQEPVTTSLPDVYGRPEYKGLFYNEYASIMLDGEEYQAKTISAFDKLFLELIVCFHCGTWFPLNEEVFESVSGDEWCTVCVENDSVACDGCNYVAHLDDIHYIDETGEPYCDGCYDNHRNAIGGYSDNPEILFYKYCNREKSIVEVSHQDRTPFYGVELEVEDAAGDKHRVAKEIRDYGGYKKYFWCKSDGSLDDGFEICSHPLTFEAWREFDLQDAIFKHRGDVKSYHTNTCGIHIHINRTAFSDIHVLKFMTFIHEYKKLTHFIAQRRKWSEYNNYAKFEEGIIRKSQRAMARDIKEKKYRMNAGSNVTTYCTISTGDKYVPVNIQHKDSIEVRVFKGNLREVSFRKNIEYLDALYYWTKNTPLKRLDIKEFGRYMEQNRKKYPNLNMYIEERQSDYRDCFVTSKAIAEELHI